AEVGVGDAGAGHIGDREPEVGDDPRRERVAHTGQQHGRAGAQQLTKLTAGGEGWHRYVLFGEGLMAHYSDRGETRISKLEHRPHDWPASAGATMIAAPEPCACIVGVPLSTGSSFSWSSSRLGRSAASLSGPTG